MNTDSGAQPNRRTARSFLGRKGWLSWLNVALAVALVVWGIGYVIREITLVEIGRALSQARPGYILLAQLTILLTLWAKAHRWRRLFEPAADRPPFGAAFQAMMLGQLVNAVVSLLRLGDIARVYALSQQTGLSKMRAMGTLVVEKTADLLMLVVTLAVLLPFIVVPAFVAEQGATLAVASGGALLGLVLLATRAEQVLAVARPVLDRLPPYAADRLWRWANAVLAGLGALRRRRGAVGLLASSAFIALLSYLTPWLMFPALRLPFGLAEATLLHLVMAIASVIPVPTPARIGVFEFAVIFMLRQFGLNDEAVAFSYAILFHLIIVLPQIAFGALAAARTEWSWRRVWQAAPLPVEQGKPVG